MKTERLPSRWQSSQSALRAVQVAFDVSEAVLLEIRREAFAASISNSDQVRLVLGLPVTRHAQRPRLTVSLSIEDYALLGKRYRLDPADHLAIKERVIVELIAFAQARARRQRVARPRAAASQPLQGLRAGPSRPRRTGKRSTERTK